MLRDCRHISQRGAVAVIGDVGGHLDQIQGALSFLGAMAMILGCQRTSR